MHEANSTLYSVVPAAVPDPIIGTNEAFKKDLAPEKVNLGIGVYQDERGAMPIFRCVKEAERRLLDEEDTKAYLPIEGLAAFRDEVQSLVFGDSALIGQGRIATVQTVGGSGALRIGADFLKRFFPESSLYASSPTWDNHPTLFSAAGHTVESYPYFDSTTRGLAREAMFDALRRLPKRTIVVTHGCCHNPTGVDLELADWETLASVCVERELIPFVDLAYQGLGTGLAEDSAGARILAGHGLPVLVALSFSKSFSLYRERVGALFVACSSAEECARVLGQLKRATRTQISNPNSHGAQIVAMCLRDRQLRALWEQELGSVRSRIQAMRTLFTKTLSGMMPSTDLQFINDQKGMFSFFGLDADAVRKLREKHHVYVIESGRVCVAAMNEKTMEYVCAAICDVLQ